MGAAESRKETETNNNNVYLPNLLARQIIGEPEENTEDKKDKIISDTSFNDKKNNDNKDVIVIKENIIQEKDEINRTEEFDDIKTKKTLGGNIFSNVNRGQFFNNQNLFISQTANAIKMEITNQKQDIDYRKFKFNGITVIQNLKEYIPNDITRDELKEMVYNAFGEGLVDDNKYYIPGKTVTRNQANEIITLIESYIRNDEIVTNLENTSILDGINLVIDLVDLNKDIIKEKMFKGKNPSEVQLENTLKNLSGGLTNVKILSIDFQ